MTNYLGCRLIGALFLVIISKPDVFGGKNLKIIYSLQSTTCYQCQERMLLIIQYVLVLDIFQKLALMKAICYLSLVCIFLYCVLKSDNLQYNTLGLRIDRLIDQASVVQVLFCQIENTVVPRPTLSLCPQKTQHRSKQHNSGVVFCSKCPGLFQNSIVVKKA